MDIVLNQSKTKFMVINGSDADRAPINIARLPTDVCISYCNDYVYLGASFTDDGKTSLSIALLKIAFRCRLYAIYPSSVPQNYRFLPLSFCHFCGENYTHKKMSVPHYQTRLWWIEHKQDCLQQSAGADDRVGTIRVQLLGVQQQHASLSAKKSQFILNQS
ncbi:hypothetical protein CAPTEDRAFT_205936 [Capitella teleta]|uniref:Uncharacterized protein n=1 Tax=Capitella teleta TaxID=283909 RepID=R7U8T4_CAPTE|nr:hypothetical protein CAPTEDRAFT_205936 [Capitella teleta]|eukprot:ELU02384.1 hypothetical protein CAPTEDRAFT_205936 [Capitella teleta]